DTILAGLDVLAATKARMRNSNHGRVLLEMALVRLGRLDDLLPLGQIAEMLSGAGAPPAAGAPRPTPRAATAEPPDAAKKKFPAASEVAPAPAGPIPLSAETLPRVWQELLAQAGPLLASELERAEFPAISGPNTLVLRFPLRYNQPRESGQEPVRVA